MREIKFRGKRTDNGEWVRGDLRQVEGRCYIMDYDIGDDGITDTQKVFNIHYEVDPDTVGQYTGLKDRNGRDIYERDIILDNSYGNDVGQLVDSVVWNNETGAWVWGKDEIALISESVDTIMVIGNIYDNPELLGEVRE